jgi:hypothetical protein
MHGTVAVGAPIVNGTLRVLDAAGNVVAHDVPIDANGQYADVTLTGTGPWRLEACGYAGGNWRCIYAIAQDAGTANVTPLTTAQVTLALGATPDTLMQSGAAAPSGDALSAAQSQLQAGLAGTLTDAGLPGTVDFTTSTFTAGTRTGYDRVLDAVSVTTGTDGGAFVQLQPRLGDGNLYMTPGGTTGAITPVAGAAGLSLAGLETLFAGMSAAMASADACSGGSTALAQWMASDARVTMGGGLPLVGATQVAAGFCAMFAGGGDSGQAMWGSHLDSPVLGRCDFSGADPVCGITFVLHGVDGSVHIVGDGMGVVNRGGVWAFRGNLLPIEVHANANVQRSRRIDNGIDSYVRALQFDIANTPGVACAKVQQRDAQGSATTIAYYKLHDPGAMRMSLWTADGMGNGVSLAPLVGATRSNDDTWIVLPDGTAGDDVIRNFYRGGRAVTLSLYGDAACATPAVVDGHADFTLDVLGVPPVSSAIVALPWGDLGDATRSALASLTLAAGTATTFDIDWIVPDGGTAYDQVSFCVAGGCGQGGVGRIADAAMSPALHTATLSLSAPAAAVGAGSFKSVQFYGRDGTGLGMSSSYMTCSDTPVGAWCAQ